ncbi:hypothetical protein J2S43_004320 [Catenuloplanes nepalensis]|uniref:Uncharacterized protein n=1 Tax=Catenuloplanes nepalensis TaxID=587533 RepID=A0ABT9MWJ6_9ACTN|nr:hypothetical protein [Catenuloplanes nepalensis]
MGDALITGLFRRCRGPAAGASLTPRVRVA